MGASPEITLGEYLTRHAMTLAVAESCTGGLIGHRITNVAGSSAYFLGGVITYADEAKMQMLGVRAETLAQFGAVSRQTALEMARGVRVALGADIGLSVTGIAGPGGGTPEKPVGTVWIALSAEGYENARHYLWQGDRAANKEQSAEAALRVVVEYLRGRD
jgi:PncC family amidohydrolase